jgi:hypothetical protein
MSIFDHESKLRYFCFKKIAQNKVTGTAICKRFKAFGAEEIAKANLFSKFDLFPVLMRAREFIAPILLFL